MDGCRGATLNIAAGHIGVALGNGHFGVGAAVWRLHAAAIDDLKQINSEEQLHGEISDDKHDDRGDAEAAPAAAHGNVDSPAAAAARKAKAAAHATLPAAIFNIFTGLFIVETHGIFSGKILSGFASELGEIIYQIQGWV